MTLLDVLRALRKRWRAVLAVTLIGVILAGAYLATTTKKYTAKSQLYVTAFAEANPQTQYNGVAAAQGIVPSLVLLIDKQPVLEPVVKQLGLSFDWYHLASKVSASSVPLGLNINVEVKDTSATRAQAIANAVDTHYVSYIERLYSQSVGNTPQVKLTVTQPAVAPTSPSSPSTVLDLVIGVLLGLAGGVALALFLHTLDTTVKSPDDVTQRYRIPSLGQVPYDRKSKKRPVAEFGEAKESFRTEAFRRVRTNLQFVEIESQPRSILVTSAMAEEGKTTTACNIAMGLAQVGVDVILLEGDLRRSKFTKYLGVASPGGLTSVLMGWTSWRDELVAWEDGDARVRVLTAGTHPPNPNELLASEAFVRNLTEIEDACDVVIIDGPPLLPVSDSSLIAASASGTVLVIRHGKTRYKAVEAGLEALAAVDAKLYGFVLNMGPYDARETGNYSRYASTVSS